MCNSLLKACLAISLNLALLLPVAIQFADAFEKHDYELCNEYSVHMHQAHEHCDVCDFKLSTYNYSFLNVTESDLPFMHVKRVFYSSSLKIRSSVWSYKQLRAPPMIAA